MGFFSDYLPSEKPVMLLIWERFLRLNMVDGTLLAVDVCIWLVIFHSWHLFNLYDTMGLHLFKNVPYDIFCCNIRTLSLEEKWREGHSAKQIKSFQEQEEFLEAGGCPPPHLLHPELPQNAHCRRVETEAACREAGI